ncbi:MAG: MBL fold metallo-hydrolase [Acidobacteria bacterium]|nr:MAG: MBL fold metallo-hydrolase [Acidobacteriota bacterium]
MNMHTQLFVQTAFQQNTRIVSCKETRKAICIDPGEPSDETADYVIDNDLELIAIIATHGHLDHIGGTAYMHSRFPDAEILVHRDEEPLYFSLPQQPLFMGIQPHQFRAMGMDYADPPKPTRNVEHGELLDVGNLKFEIRHCPGHTPGHIVLVEHDVRTVFTGDCLFSGTIGRTDLPGGDHAQLIDSITKNVLSLEDDFVVACGHGPDTTVGFERENNPFLNGSY